MMKNDATERVLAALEEVTRRPEYAHKVNWAVNDFIRSELQAYGRAWEQTAGPTSERGGSPMEAGEEIVGDAEAALVEKRTKVVLAAQAELQSAVVAEREACATFFDAKAEAMRSDGRAAHQGDVLCAFEYVSKTIRARTDTDAQAALETHDKRVWNKALREALALSWLCFHKCNDEIDVVTADDILALMEDTDDE